MEEKKSNHLECTVTEEGALEFILILAKSELEHEYINAYCSSIVGDDVSPVFHIMGTDTEFRNYALEVLRKSECIVCDSEHPLPSEFLDIERHDTQYENLKLKIRNNLAVSKGGGYTVEIDHNLEENSKKRKEIEDVCIQHQLNIQ